MPRMLKLKDNTIYEVDWANGDRGILNLNLITDESFIEIATKFSNKELTDSMEYRISEENVEIFEGYTELSSIAFDDWSSGTVLVILKKPENV